MGQLTWGRHLAADWLRDSKKPENQKGVQRHSFNMSMVLGSTYPAKNGSKMPTKTIPIVLASNKNRFTRSRLGFRFLT